MINKHVAKYWAKFYINGRTGLCSLCGNSGIVDTTNTATSAFGIKSGGRNFCFCPNGQEQRKYYNEYFAKKP